MKDIRTAVWATALLQVSLTSAASVPSQYNQTSECKCFPGDACWPSPTEWNAFNSSVGGRLVATTPLASVCHDSSFGSYDAEKCDALSANWFDPETHLSSVSSIMAPYFNNDSCNPFLGQNTPCTLGGLVSFAVNATCASDFSTTINFVKKHNIRLVIRNTGHDYNGKSTGAGGLAIWTHYMKDRELVDYSSPTYTGKAVKLGAGVSSLESYQFSHDHGLVTVGGDCPTVGVTGGWTQGGGGHGPGVSKFGVGADQALEWEVVTGTGEILIANREQNQDLYWALSGGGGGTYGVVSSLTTKAYPDVTSSSAALSFPAAGVNNDTYWDAIATWQTNSLDLTEAGCFLIWSASAEKFELMPGNCPGMTKNETMSKFQPTISKLAQHNMTYNLTVQQFDNFLDSYTTFNLAFPKNVSQTQLGSRLIPKTLATQNNTELNNIFRKVIDMGASLVVTAVDISKHANETEHTSINPARRDAAYSAIFSTDYNQTDYSVNVARANEMTNVLLPMLERITPNGSAYLNECDFQQPDWQNVLYGSVYPKLLEVKKKYDPEGIFYALQAVGSEGWYENKAQGGRLCRI